MNHLNQGYSAINGTTFSRFTDQPSIILGTPVVSPQDVDLGKVDEVVMNAFNTSIEFLVISHGGFWGVGTKRYALPWNAAHFDQDRQRYVLNLGQDEIASLPAYENGVWPDFTGNRWKRNVHSYFDMTLFWMP